MHDLVKSVAQIAYIALPKKQYKIIHNIIL